MKVLVGDITKLMNVDVIVNAANGVGIMGAGLAGAIGRSAGQDFLDEVRKIAKDSGPFLPGDVYISGSGLLVKRGIKKVYHAVTMKFPGERTPLSLVSPLLKKALDTALANGVQSIAFGGLGCGIGGLSKNQVAATMAPVAEGYADQIDITVIDTNQEFIDVFKSFINIKIEDQNTEET